MGKKKKNKKTLSTYQSEPDPKQRKRRPGCEAEGDVVPGQGWECSRPLCQLPRRAVRLRLASRGQHILPECRLRGAWRLTQPSPPPTGRPRLPVSYLCLLQPRLHPRLSCGFSSAFPSQHSSSLEAPECLQKPKPGSSFPSGEDINYYPLWVIILGCSLCTVSARLDGKGIFFMKPILFF